MYFDYISRSRARLGCIVESTLLKEKTLWAWVLHPVFSICFWCASLSLSLSLSLSRFNRGVLRPAPKKGWTHTESLPIQDPCHWSDRFQTVPKESGGALCHLVWQNASQDTDLQNSIHIYQGHHSNSGGNVSTALFQQNSGSHHQAVGNALIGLVLLSDPLIPWFEVTNRPVKGHLLCINLTYKDAKKV